MLFTLDEESRLIGAIPSSDGAGGAIGLGVDVREVNAGLVAEVALGWSAECSGMTGCSMCKILMVVDAGGSKAGILMGASPDPGPFFVAAVVADCPIMKASGDIDVGGFVMDVVVVGLLPFIPIFTVVTTPFVFPLFVEASFPPGTPD